MWIGVGIGAAIVLYLCIKDGGIGWVFDSDGHSSGSSNVSQSSVATPSTSSSDDLDYHRHKEQQHMSLYESYNYQYQQYKALAEKALSEAENASHYADHWHNQAQMTGDSSYYDKEL